MEIAEAGGLWMHATEDLKSAGVTTVSGTAQSVREGGPHPAFLPDSAAVEAPTGFGNCAEDYIGMGLHECDAGARGAKT
jgi:hypothetical protein